MESIITNQKKLIKKILCIMLCIIILLNYFPINSNAATEFIDGRSGSSDKNYKISGSVTFKATATPSHQTSYLADGGATCSGRSSAKASVKVYDLFTGAQIGNDSASKAAVDPHGNQTGVSSSEVTASVTVNGNEHQYVRVVRNASYGDFNAWVESGTLHAKRGEYNVSKTEGGTVEECGTPYKQIVYVRYQNADGSYGNYQKVIDAPYFTTQRVVWASEDTNVYKGVTINYAVTGEHTEYVNIDRKQYKLTLGKGTGIESVSGEGTYRAGETINVSANTSTGYDFKEWRGVIVDNDSTSEIILNESSSSLTLSQNLYLEANATPHTYEVIYNGNGHTGGETQTSNHFYGIPKKLTRNGFSKFAYEFRGWTVNADGTGTSYTEEETVNNLTSENGGRVNLYAKWGLITKNIKGNVIWNDFNNRYSSRPANVQVTLSSDERPTEAGALGTPSTNTIVEGAYEFNNLQVYKVTNGTPYTYRISQNEVQGYETIIDGYNITNNLIVPEYSSNITYTPVDSFQNTMLKNGKVKLVANVNASANNREQVGMHNGIVNFKVDDKIELNLDTLKIVFTDASTNQSINITNTDYQINGNLITVNYGTDKITQKGDSITIEIIGELKELGEYSSNIKATGNLIDYKGRQLPVYLGEVTNNTQNVTIQNQLPEAKIQIMKVDSVERVNLSDAEFTLYEWNGTEYIPIEVIKDLDGDGIYESNYYRWNVVTQGKYKIVETKIPQNHKDSKFSMQYTLNKIRPENYIIIPEYSNREYVIEYEVGNPDNFQGRNSIVENEPYKLKARIYKIDGQTKQTIQSNATFTIYEWDKDNENYKEYVSYVTNEKVEMQRQGEYYETTEYLYYTTQNEGKYRIVETTAPQGYAGDYAQNSEKNTYDFNIVDIVTNEEYKGQAVNNEGTIKITNNNEETFENTRVSAKLNITVVDKETEGKTQGDAKIQGAVYGIYASEQINHADGTTSRYENEPSVLYKKDELIRRETTNEQGKLIFDQLECGKYYIKMLEAPEGYMLDETIYEAEFPYQGEEKGQLEILGTIKITVKKQGFQLYKLKENTEVLKNAGFTIYLISDLSIIKEGKITRVSKNTYILNDETAKQSVQLSKKQNKDGTYYIADLIDYYYKVDYTEENKDTLPGDEEVYHPYNIREALVKDYSTSIEGNDIVEIRTNEDGYMNSPELAYGEYIVIETSVPRKEQEAKPFVIKVEEDNRQLQSLRFVIDKDFKTRIKIYTKDANTRNIIKNKKSSYVIKNEETQEYMTIAQWNGEEYIDQGTLENPFRVGKEGYFISPMELPIGKYVLEELTAPEGYVVNGKEGHAENNQTIWTPREKVKFEVASNSIYYMDHYFENYVIVEEQYNEETVGSVTVKTIGEYLSNAQKEGDKYNFTYEQRPVQGIKYKIYAKEDIYTKDNQGTLVYKQDEEVTQATTNENGEAFIENIPLGKYYIKQAEVVEGFSKNENIIDVELNYKGQEVPVVFVEFEEESNKTIRQKVEILIHNKDKETEEKRIGGIYGIYTKEEITYTDSNGQTRNIPANELICTQVANEKGIIEINKDVNVDLPRGLYYLKEIEAPKGYILQELELEIDTTKQPQVENIKIEKDFYGTQTGIIIKEINEEENITQGSIFEIRNKETGKVIKEFTTKAQEEIIKKLETNIEYELVETKPAPGYTTATKVNFIINENGKLCIEEVEQEQNIIVIRDYKTILQVEITEENTQVYTIGQKWQIIRKTEEGKEEVINELITEGIEKQIEKLPIGSYILREIGLGENTGYVTNKDITFNVEDTKELQYLKLQQNISKLKIEVTDEETKEKMNNLEIQIVDKKTKQIVAKTGKQEEILEIKERKQDYYVEKLPIGEYILIQKLPEGYKELGEIQIAVKDLTDIQIIKIDNRKLIYDMKIEKELESITVNGKSKIVQKGQIQKIEIAEKEINTVDVQLQYVIRVSNIGEIKAKIGKIIDNVPNGFKVISTEWKEENGKAIWNAENEELEPGKNKEVRITLKWQNNKNNFGEKKNTAELKGSTNQYNYKDKNSGNDIGESTVVFSIKTGEEIYFKIMEIVLIGCIVIGFVLSIEIIIIKRKNKFKL